MKIVALLSRFPYPLEKGDKLRAFHLLRELSAYHEIHVFALTEEKISEEQMQAISWASSVEVVHISRPEIAWALLLNVAGIVPFQAAYFYHSSARTKLAAFMDEVQPDHIYCQLLRMALYVKDFPEVPATIDYMDAFAAGMKRRMQQSKGIEKIAARIEFNRLAGFEAQVFPWFQYHTIISEQDRSLIHHQDNDQIQVISNGIDTEFFQPVDGTRDIDIVFCGNMSYPPNVRAAVRLVKEILPLIQQTLPDVQVAIIGTTPAPEVRLLAGKQVTVTGWVDDTRLWYNRAKIMAAPMDIGAGLQNKLLEAMAMGIPCVTTTLAAQAMHPDLQAHLAVFDDNTDFATACCRLLQDEGIMANTGIEVRRLVEQHHNWSAMAQQLSSLWANSGSLSR